MALKERILVVDDSSTMLSFMDSVCRDEGYEVVKAESGLQAIVELKRNPSFQAMVIDWIMPEMNGIDFLEKIKRKDKWKQIPVIMQTGKRDNAAALRGIQAGAYFYLTKPYTQKDFRHILKCAVEEYNIQKRLRALETNTVGDISLLMDKGSFSFRTFDEASVVAAWLSRLSTKENISIGLEELFKNGIEHGNLGLNYEIKSELLEEDIYEQEIGRRLNLEENKAKMIRVSFEKENSQVSVHIRDMGKGFEFEKYLDFSPDRVYDLHGRGIAIANKHVFESIQYLKGGCEVTACFNVQGGSE